MTPFLKKIESVSNKYAYYHKRIRNCTNFQVFDQK